MFSVGSYLYIEFVAQALMALVFFFLERPSELSLKKNERILRHTKNSPKEVEAS